MSISVLWITFSIGSRWTSTSNIERSIESGFSPWLIVRLPCGSRSTQSTRISFSSSAAARFSVDVVLATPPFWFANAMNCEPFAARRDLPPVFAGAKEGAKGPLGLPISTGRKTVLHLLHCAAKHESGTGIALNFERFFVPSGPRGRDPRPVRLPRRPPGSVSARLRRSPRAGRPRPTPRPPRGARAPRRAALPPAHRPA